MADQRIIRVSFGCRDMPYLDCLVKRSRCKKIRVFWIQTHIHNVVFVVVIRVDFFPIFFPIPQFDRQIIWTRKYIRKSCVNYEAPNVILMSLNFFNKLGGVVVKDVHVSIICSNHNPLLFDQKSSTSDGSFKNFKLLNAGLWVNEDLHEYWSQK